MPTTSVTHWWPAGWTEAYSETVTATTEPAETPETPTVDSVRAELAALENPKARAVNERHGDDHGVNLSTLRAVAKATKKTVQDQAKADGAKTTEATQRAHAFALDLWDTGNTAARLVALLMVRPKSFTAEQLDAMLRETRAPKTTDWLISYAVLKSAHVEELRRLWLNDDDTDPIVLAAGWALTAETVVKHPERLEQKGADGLDAVLDTIEAQMVDAAERPQWQMNTTLAMIGIHHRKHRDRAVTIGERLAVLKDYPTPPNCTSPYAPEWIDEMVRRQNT